LSNNFGADTLAVASLPKHLIGVRGEENSVVRFLCFCSAQTRMLAAQESAENGESIIKSCKVCA
jgi:hypothetical protein